MLTEARSVVQGTWTSSEDQREISHSTQRKKERKKSYQSGISSFFWLRAAPPRRRLAACAAARLTQAGPRVERAGQPALGARASPVGAGAAWMSGKKLPKSARFLREPPGRRPPSTCGDAEVRGVPFLVCYRRGGGVAGRPSRPRHAGAPAPRPLPPRYRPFGSRAVGRRGGSRGRRCAPAVGGRGDHLSPGLRRLGGPARPPCASRGRMPRGAFARGRFWYRRGGAAWAGAAQPLAVGCPRLGRLPWLALCPASLSG